MGRHRPQWSDAIYEAAIDAVTEMQAKLSHIFPRTPRQVALSQAAEVLRYERHLHTRRGGQ